MSLHKEVHFEAEICAHLAKHGWLYAEGDAAGFDRASGLYLPDLQDWLQATQPQAWGKLANTHGANVMGVLADRMRKTLNERGTLEVLRRGVDMLGLAAPLSLAQFRPALALNTVTQAHYAANRLRVVRLVCQCHGDRVRQQKFEKLGAERAFQVESEAIDAELCKGLVWRTGHGDAQTSHGAGCHRIGRRGQRQAHRRRRLLVQRDAGRGPSARPGRRRVVHMGERADMHPGRPLLDAGSEPAGYPSHPRERWPR